MDKVPPVVPTDSTNTAQPAVSPVQPTGMLRARVVSLGFCVLLLVFGLYLLSSNNINASWIHTVGEVVNSQMNLYQHDEKRDITVRYNVAGHDYNVFDTVSAGGKTAKGDKREVAYNPNTPAEAKLIKSGYDNAIPWTIVIVSIGLIVYLFAIFFVKRQPVGRVQ